MRNRRVQMELLVLAIIMVIVVLGLMLALRFFFLVPPENPVQLARDTHLGANLLDSMFETKTTCSNRRLIELVTDCATGGGSSCAAVDVGDAQTGLHIIEGDSCLHATRIVEYMFERTLKLQGREYVFTIEGPGSVGDIQASNPPGATACAGSAHLTPRVKPIGNQQTLTFKLLLCE